MIYHDICEMSLSLLRLVRLRMPFRLPKLRCRPLCAAYQGTTSTPMSAMVSLGGQRMLDIGQNGSCVPILAGDYLDWVVNPRGKRWNRSSKGMGNTNVIVPLQRARKVPTSSVMLARAQCHQQVAQVYYQPCLRFMTKTQRQLRHFQLQGDPRLIVSQKNHGCTKKKIVIKDGWQTKTDAYNRCQDLAQKYPPPRAELSCLL